MYMDEKGIHRQVTQGRQDSTKHSDDIPQKGRILTIQIKGNVETARDNEAKRNCRINFSIAIQIPP